MQGNEELSGSTVRAARKSPVQQRITVLAMVTVAALAFGLSACGGSASPGVANLEKNSGHGTGNTRTTTPPTGNPSELLVEWTACMRRHGDPNQTDPSIDASKVIHVTFPTDYHSTSGGLSGPCGSYIAGAERALGGGKLPKPPDQAQLVKFASCMRANGIKDFPDPGNGGLVLKVGGDLNPGNPTFQNASKVCAQRTGVEGFSGTPQPGTVEAKGGGPPCNARSAAANALRAGSGDSKRAELTTFAEC